MTPLLILLAVLLRFTHACCASAFNVTYLFSTSPHSSKDFYYSGDKNRTLLFKVHDPDPVTNATTLCGATWFANQTAPQGWAVCQNPTFLWQFGSDFSFSNVTSYRSCRNFGISVRHTFKDPSVGTGIYGYRTTEGWTSFNATNLVCTRMSFSHQRSCGLPQGEVVDIPIYVEA